VRHQEHQKLSTLVSVAADRNDTGYWQSHGAVLELGAMRIRIYSNEVEAHLTNFIGKFLANVCFGIAASLKTPMPIRSLKFEIQGDDVRIDVNQSPLSLNMSQGFSKVIILDTIRGMIRHLKMADPQGDIRIEMDIEPES
jgi:hypothetical protein